MKKIFTIIGSILAIVIVSGAIIAAPGIAERQRIARSRIANYKNDRYIGWALALNAIQEANDTFYTERSTDKKSEEFKRAEERGYPSKYFPTLVEEFGIVVQKEYSSNYIFTQQKRELTNYLGRVLSDLKQAQNNYVDSEQPANANDANVRAALEYYYTLFEKVQSSVERMTLEEAQSGALGQRIINDVGEDVFSKPIAYGQIATEYLEVNLKLHAGTFPANSSDDETLSQELIEKTETIMGLNK